MVIVFWLIKTYNFVIIHYKYKDISVYFYWGYVFICVFLPLIWMIIARILLGFILIIKKNQELTNTIKNILKIFPEGILIQSIDENTKETILKFANDTAKADIINYEDPIGLPILDEKLEYILKEVDDYKETENFVDQGHEINRMTLSELLSKHLYFIEIHENVVTSNIELISTVNSNPQSKYFNVKSMRVKWGSCKTSYIHMFVNTTCIK